MPVRLNKLSLAALGLVSRLGAQRDVAETAEFDCESEAKTGTSLDDLVEAGEAAYDEFLTGLTTARDELQEKLKEAASGFLSGLGFVTRKEMDELRGKARDEDGE